MTAVRRVRWAQACRIVPTRHPSVYLFDRVAGAEDFDALKHPAEAYPVSGTLQGKVLQLVFKDGGKAVPVSLTLPARFVNFSADIHDGKRFGAGGPLLYKEWRFEGPAKDAGLFKTGQAPNRYVLVLQGRGGRCDEPGQFTHWHLRLIGGQTDYAFTGAVAK
ncbi:MAG: hypothetical protein ACK46X_16815 [Candidatus Sericytochromatia bacterium]